MNALQYAGTALAKAAVAAKGQGDTRGRSHTKRQCAACGAICRPGSVVTRIEFVSATSILADLHFACGSDCAQKIRGDVRFASPPSAVTSEQQPRVSLPRKPVEPGRVTSLARTCGVSEQTVRNWLAGKFRPRQRHLPALRAAGVTLPDYSGCKPVDHVDGDALASEHGEDFGIGERKAVTGTGEAASGESLVQSSAEHGGHEHGDDLLLGERERS
jgi:hypothetical protein